MIHAYLQLRTRVDRHVQSVVTRYDEQIACRLGCDKCCVAGLTLVLVEAVVLGRALGIEDERVLLQAGQPPHASEGPCALLDPDGRCRAYRARPLICRTQGIPLAYPDTAALSCCELNFQSLEPHRSAALDMENLETALFAANLAFCRTLDLHPLSRVAIDRLAPLAGIEGKK